jgi:hypothetical protein
MTSTARTRRVATAAAWVAAGALGATAVTGIAVAAGTPSPVQAESPVATASAPGGPGGAAPARTGRRAGALRNVLHGRLTVRTATGTATVDLQRGTITAASATSVTVASSDGFTATYAIGSSTTVRRDRRTVPATSLAVGDVALVRARGGTAVVVRARSADAASPGTA